MTGPEWIVIYGTGVVLVTITAVRFVMHELAGAVRQYKELRSLFRTETKSLPPQEDDITEYRSRPPRTGA